jgi:hypothetical protein
MSGSSLRKESPYNKLYEAIKRYNSSVFGEIIQLTNMEQTHDVMSKNYIFTDRNEARQKVEQSKRRSHMKHANLLQFLDYCVEEKSGWCSTSWIVKWYFPFVNHSLRKELTIRKAEGDHFLNVELTALIYEQVDLLATLQNFSYPIQDISPDTIFLQKNPDRIFTVLVDDYKDIDYYQLQQNNFSQRKPMYVSPEVFNALCYGNKTMPGGFKHAAFSFGLVLLELGTQRDVQGIYARDRKEIDQGCLEELLGEFTKVHLKSPWLFDTVRKLLEMDEHERFDFMKLKETLPERSIVDQWNKRLQFGDFEEDLHYGGQEEGGHEVNVEAQRPEHMHMLADLDHHDQEVEHHQPQDYHHREIEHHQPQDYHHREIEHHQPQDYHRQEIEHHQPQDYHRQFQQSEVFGRHESPIRHESRVVQHSAPVHQTHSNGIICF